MSNEFEVVDIVNRNAEAFKTTLLRLHERMDELEEENKRMRNIAQTCLNEVQQLKHTNTLALSSLKGTGPTSGN